MGKYLFLTHAGDPGGAEFNMLGYCLGLGPGKVEVLQFQQGSLKEQLSRRGITGHVLEMPEILANFKRDESVVGALKLIPAIVTMFLTLIRQTRQYDVLICMSQKAFFLTALTRLFTRKPIIWFMNDLITPESFNKNLILLMVTFAKLFASHIVVNSRASLDAWIAAGGPTHKTSVIYPGINFHEFDAINTDQESIAALRKQYCVDDDTLLIGMFGRIAHWKGQDVFIKALSKLNNVRAIIVGEAYFGEDGYKQELASLTDSLNLSDKTIFTGHLDNIPAVMSACDIIVHCSRTPEPYGMVIVEALAARKPVIASDGGGAAEILINRSTGLLTPLGDDASLAQAIQLYMDDKALARKLAAHGYDDAKSRFSTDSMIIKLNHILESLKPTNAIT